MMLRVIKRDGTFENAQFQKVTNRIEFLAKGVLRDGTEIGDSLDNVSPALVAKEVISQISDGITTSKLDEFAAQYCASMAIEHHEYSLLGGRIAVSNHQKNTISSFSETMRLLYENTDGAGNPDPLICRRVYKFVAKNRDRIESMIDIRRDYLLDYFGFETLKSKYFLRRTDDLRENVMETPQYIYMRVAVSVSVKDADEPLTDELFNNIRKTYNLLSLGFYTHATPTMYNAGTRTEQLSSCFLLGVGDNLAEDGGIGDLWKSTGLISKYAGGIGIGVQPIRAAGTLIAGTGGTSDGIVPFCRVLNNISTYINQGGRRPGAFKMSIEPWHGDIYDFLDLKKNHGVEDLRARDLTYALWVPDIFMTRLIKALTSGETVMWSLMCPHKSPGLYTTYGKEFEKLYLEYEKKGNYIRQVDIRDLWNAILVAQKETGGPDILYKDHVNSKNNQANLGVIRNSNLCSEILEYSDEKEYAVCNLASVSMVAHVNEGKFDFKQLIDTCMHAHMNLDSVIDMNYYPVEKCRYSNLRHRPVGLGTQGFADCLLALDLPFETTYTKPDGKIGKCVDPKTRRLNKIMAECMYYASLKSSMELAKARHEGMKTLHHAWKNGDIKFSPNGLTVTYCIPELADLVRKLRPIEQELDRDSHWGSYSSFIGSPTSKGLLQYHLWGIKEPLTNNKECPEIYLDWDQLIEDIILYGLRNSLLRADMPTATTAQILGNSECTEPYKYAVFTRRVSSGEFVVVNRYLHQELQEKGLWSQEIKRQLVKDRGSVQHLPGLDQRMKEKYLTAYEIQKKTIQQLAADRGPYIDQTQSMNMFVPNPTDKLLSSMHIGAWKLGLKTGMYYLRRGKIKNAVQFTVTDCESCSA